MQAMMDNDAIEYVTRVCRKCIACSVCKAYETKPTDGGTGYRDFVMATHVVFFTTFVIDFSEKSSTPHGLKRSGASVL